MQRTAARHLSGSGLEVEVTVEGEGDVERGDGERGRVNMRSAPEMRMRESVRVWDSPAPGPPPEKQHEQQRPPSKSRAVYSLIIEKRQRLSSPLATHDALLWAGSVWRRGHQVRTPPQVLLLLCPASSSTAGGLCSLTWGGRNLPENDSALQNRREVVDPTVIAFFIPPSGVPLWAAAAAA